MTHVQIKKLKKETAKAVAALQPEKKKARRSRNLLSGVASLYCNQEYYLYICIVAKGALEDWFSKTEEAEWNNFAEMKQIFNSVDATGKRRYVFNIKGNTYCLVAMFCLYQSMCI
jgi:hypothetical protein